MTTIVNSGFPSGMNDGALWAGRGLTAEIRGGARVGWRALDLEVSPTVFASQNAAFAIFDNRLEGSMAYADWLRPEAIDLPQRFGPGSFIALEPGESSARVEAGALSFGAATSTEVWGPAVEHSLILGNNAAGIPRVFLGTAHPVEIAGMRIHGRIFWGWLQHSKYTTDSDGKSGHFATAAVGTVSLKSIPGLEIGAARFFHVKATKSVPWARVFGGFLKDRLGALGVAEADSTDNQLASIFLRLAPPGGGFEVYGEFGREDHNGDLRDFLKEPDHDAAYLIGLQRAWRRGPDSTGEVTVFRAEVLNARLSHLQQNSTQVPWYIHAIITQGHTHKGQALGSAAAYGGGGSTVAIDRYSAAGRVTVRWDRIMMGEFRNAYGLPVGEAADVLHSLSVDRLRFRGSYEVGTSLALQREFNRHFTGDAWSVSARARLGWRARTR